MRTNRRRFYQYIVRKYTISTFLIDFLCVYLSFKICFHFRKRSKKFFSTNDEFSFDNFIRFQDDSRDKQNQRNQRNRRIRATIDADFCSRENQKRAFCTQ